MNDRPTLLFLCDDPDALGGIQRVLATLIQEFTRRSYRVVITSLFDSSDATAGFVDPAIQRVTLFSEGRISRWLQRPRLGPLHLRGRRLLRLRVLAQRAARRKLREQVATLRPHAVIVFDSLMAKLAAESRLTDTKVLVQYHNSFDSVFGSADFKRLRRASAHVSTFLALTQADAAAFASAGFDRVSYIGNPVSFYPNELAANRERRVVALGRFHHQKAFDHLITAWAKVGRKDGWRLDIYGDGPERGAIEAMVTALKLEDYATVHRPTRDAESVLRRASIYALSSRYEGLCMVALEAIACGIPIVATASGPGTLEIVEDCGLISEIGDTAAFATNLQRLIDNPEMRTRFSHTGRTKALQYTVEAIADQWERLINTAVPL